MSSVQRKAELKQGETIKTRLLESAYIGGALAQDEKDGKPIDRKDLVLAHGVSEQCVKDLNRIYAKNMSFAEWVKNIIKECSNEN